MTTMLDAARSLAGLALAGALTGALAGCATPEQEAGETASAEAADHTTPAPFNEADVMFASMMVPHHAQAIEMAHLVLDKEGVSPEVADLATRIRDAQAPEIELMTTWLGEWDAEDALTMDHSQHGGMDGMLGQGELTAIAEAATPEAERLFLEGMIAHHEGAVTMAQDQRAAGANPSALALAEEIIDAQQAEIDEMRTLLAER